MDLKKQLQIAQDFLNRGKIIDAKKSFNKILKKFPTNVDILNVLASIELKQNQRDNALSYLKKSLLINPNQPMMLFNIAVCQIEEKNFLDSLESINKAIKILPNTSNFYFTKAKAFFGLEDFKSAEENYLKTIELDDKFELAYLNLAHLYNIKTDFDSAIEVLQKLIKLNPSFVEAHYNLAISFDNKKKFDKAIYHYEKVINFDNSNLKAHYNLSILLLYTGSFEKGWREFEYRWNEIAKPDFTNLIPEYINLNKNKNKNKNLLIWGEQGIGDQILYSSMIQDLYFEGDLTIALDKRLIKIYENSFEKIQFIDLKNIENINNYDEQLAIGSLGKFLRKTRESFKNQKKSFLKSNQQRTKYYRDALNKENKIICGVAWKSKNNVIGHFKSIDLELLLPIFETFPFKFVDLQYGETISERDSLENKYKIKIHNFDELDKFNDLDGLFSLIDACDLIVTSSNVTAHIAGALGKKTFLFIPYSFGAAWYWHDDNFIGWYPSVRIFRQTIQGCWDQPIQNICEEIKNFNTINF